MILTHDYFCDNMHFLIVNYNNLKGLRNFDKILYYKL